MTNVVQFPTPPEYASQEEVRELYESYAQPVYVTLQMPAPPPPPSAWRHVWGFLAGFLVVTLVLSVVIQ